jgi:hypothetical protein
MAVTSQYLSSNSTRRAWRPAFSQAINVEPDPLNTSSTVSRLLLELRMARSTSSTGFIVGCRSLTTGFFTNHTSPCARLNILGRWDTVRRFQEFSGKPATLEGDGRAFADIAAERLGVAA